MVILPLILAVALKLSQINGYQPGCCPGSSPPTPQCVSCDYAPNCKQVTPLGVPESASVRARSGPMFTTSVRNTRSSTVDSICSTLVNAGQNVFLQFRTIVDKTGRVQIRKYLTTDVARSPGKYILAGDTSSNGGGATVKYEYFINQLTCQNYEITGFYTCTVFKTCASRNDYIYGYDNLFTLSTCGKPPSSCLSQTEAQLVASNTFNSTSFYNPPYSAPFKCVCSFNGVDVINRNRIPNENCISLPQNF